MFVKPAEGLVIRDPDLLDLLPATGREVPDSVYWQRRLRDRDVVEADPIESQANEPAEAVLHEQPAEAPINIDFAQGDD